MMGSWIVSGTFLLLVIGLGAVHLFSRNEGRRRRALTLLKLLLRSPRN
jgi:hypothetical protein